MEDEFVSDSVDPEPARSREDLDAELELLLEEEAALIAGGAYRGEPGGGVVLLVGLLVIGLWVLVLLALVLFVLANTGVDLGFVGDLLRSLPFSLLGGAW